MAVDQPIGEGEDLEMLVDEKDLAYIDLDLLEEDYNKKSYNPSLLSSYKKFTKYILTP
jgi:hypothetical protein